MLSYQLVMSDKSGMYSGQNWVIDQNMFYVVDDRNRVYDMVYVMCVYRPNRLDNVNVRCFQHTIKKKNKK